MLIWTKAKAMMPADLRKAVSRLLGRDQRPRVRRYIPHGVSIELFFSSLRQAGVRCVVLRWFETLPNIEMGEDIDILVQDDDLTVLGDFLDNTSGSVPCDIYTVGGLPGSQYRSQPYFPARLARSIIAGRLLLDGRYPVPSTPDHFHSLAYHAVYQKGLQSGLPTIHAELSPMAEPEHDYAEVLARLRDELGLDLTITMESLDKHLADLAYRPSHADLVNLARSNPWIGKHLLANSPAP